MNEFDQHRRTNIVLISALLTGATVILGKIKDKRDGKKEEVMWENDKYKVSKKK